MKNLLYKSITDFNFNKKLFNNFIIKEDYSISSKVLIENFEKNGDLLLSYYFSQDFENLNKIISFFLADLPIKEESFFEIFGKKEIGIIFMEIMNIKENGFIYPEYFDKDILILNTSKNLFYLTSKLLEINQFLINNNFIEIFINNWFQYPLNIKIMILGIFSNILLNIEITNELIYLISDICFNEIFQSDDVEFEIFCCKIFFLISSKKNLYLNTFLQKLFNLFHIIIDRELIHLYEYSIGGLFHLIKNHNIDLLNNDINKFLKIVQIGFKSYNDSIQFYSILLLKILIKKNDQNFINLIQSFINMTYFTSILLSNNRDLIQIISYFLDFFIDKYQNIVIDFFLQIDLYLAIISIFDEVEFHIREKLMNILLKSIIYSLNSQINYFIKKIFLEKIIDFILSSKKLDLFLNAFNKLKESSIEFKNLLFELNSFDMLIENNIINKNFF